MGAGGGREARRGRRLGKGNWSGRVMERVVRMLWGWLSGCWGGNGDGKRWVSTAGSEVGEGNGSGSIMERDLRVGGGAFVGRCALGSVLLPDLQVKSVQGLRVIDASALRVMQFSSGPMASTYMLAE